MRPVVWVLLPVYNGAQFLEEQLESILNQSYSPARILCRDDGSNDGSLEILEAYESRYPTQIQRLSDKPQRLGVVGSVNHLMQAALRFREKANPAQQLYYALSDQDDVWLCEKLAVEVDALEAAEVESRHMPTLVHSDLCVMEEDMTELAASFMQYQGLDPRQTSFQAQLVSNTVTGCTTLFNEAVLRKALPIPSAVMMHDWWLSLVASAFGHLVYVPAALVHYRQHTSNTLGAREHDPLRLDGAGIKRLFRWRKESWRQQQIEGIVRQAEIFGARYADALDSRVATALDNVQGLDRLGLWRQRIAFRRMRG